MRRLAKVLGCMALLALVASGPAGSQEELVTDLSDHLISIESNFTGAEILIFGAVGGGDQGQRDIVIVVRGPNAPVTVRRKARVGGIWVNYDSATFEDVPGYYAVTSTRPLSQIASKEVLERLGLGPANLRSEIAETSVPSGEVTEDDFRDAIVRLRRQDDLFKEKSEVVFRSRSLFRAEIDMPANVPDGDYSAQVYLFRNGELAHAQTTRLFVRKAGFERLVFEFANEQPLYYGILAVLVAMVAGWTASAVFRSS